MYYAVLIAVSTNALLWDPLLLCTLHRALGNTSSNYDNAMLAMGIWITCSKPVKLFPHFLRTPGELLLFQFTSVSHTICHWSMCGAS